MHTAYLITIVTVLATILDGEAIEFAIDGSDSESADLPVISFRRSPQPHNAGPSGNVDFVQRSESTSRVNHCSDPRSRRATPAHGPAVGWRSEDRTRPSRVTGPGTVDAGLSRSRRTGTGTIRRKRLRRPAPGQKSVFNVVR